MDKINPASKVIRIGDRKSKKQTKEDYKRRFGKGPEPPKGA